ncbi:MAG: RNA polymerase factor sigma-54 [Bacteroidales bacterium]|nr:RNA polymerase factor sigma-54 [Bacteroidales bacterium]
MLKTGLELKQQQKLSPLQIQTIKLIEMPIQELEQRIRTEFEENPVLEDSLPEGAEAQEVSIDQLKEEDDYIPGYRTQVRNWGKDPRPEFPVFSDRESFSQSLLTQLGFRNLSPHEYEVASFIIGSLDDKGYLRRDISALVDDMAFRANIQTDEAEVARMLTVIQGFEPPGIGARDLQECMLLQLRVRKQTDDVRLAVRILTEAFSDLSNHHYAKILSRLEITEAQLKDAIDVITKLNPKPGEAGDTTAQPIIPDFVLEEQDGELILTTPRFSVPELRVSRKYAEMLENAQGSPSRAQKEAVAFVKQKLDAAKWFVEALKQRQNTLKMTMQAILDYQHAYFLDGEESSLRPMVLKDIAQKTGFDISTISRVVNSKYIETRFGIFPLKYFFSEGLENQEGEEVSTRELKKVLQECVDAEDKHKPLTDEQLVEKMSARGYKVARRTIAKYREQLGISPARWRKEL